MSVIKVDEIENLNGSIKPVKNIVAKVDTISDLLNIDTSKLETGEQFHVLGYHTRNDGGGGIFYWDADEDKANHNGGTIIDPTQTFPSDWSDTTQQETWFTASGTGNGCWKRVVGDYVTPEMFGAKGDGVTDDTEAIQRIVDFSDIVIFNRKYLFDSLTIIKDVVAFGAGTLVCKGSIIVPTSDKTIKMKNLTFNVVEMNSDSHALFQIGNTDTVAYPDTPKENNNLILENCIFDFNIDVIILRLWYSQNINVRNCIFKRQTISGITSHDTNVAIMFNVDSGNTSYLNIDISNNIFENLNCAINNYSSGYYDCKGNISNNVFKNCIKNVRLYHMYNVVYENNKHFDSQEEDYLWRVAFVKGNYWNNCGSDSSGCVLLEAFGSAKGGEFIGNIIRNFKGYGIIIDGEAKGLISGNQIIVDVGTSTGKSGIYIQPEYNYGGQPSTLRVLNNDIRGCLYHGIEIIADNTIRNLIIKGNTITACGREGTSNTYAGIKAVVSSDKTIKLWILDNYIRANDDTYGYQDSVMGYDILIDDTDANPSTIYVKDNTLIAGDIQFQNYRTYGVKILTHNIVADASTLNVSSNGTVLVSQNIDLASGTIS